MMQTTNVTQSISYLLIGSGRVAAHISYYFQLLNISRNFKFQSWDRAQDPHALARKVSGATHVLLAIKDDAILPFYRQHLAGHDVTVVHFSGAHHYEGLIAAHPLMTFSSELYTQELYGKIHFAVTGANSLAEALPGLPNSFTLLSAEQKPMYHALCVMGGNFVNLLTQKMLSGFAEMNIPAEAARPYIDKTIENVFANGSKALSGPLVRKDVATIGANLRALQGDDFKPIYEAFLKTYWSDYPNTAGKPQ
jgi:predicted short-subunit dehydrogenase-like oxidoreductase (DUF2520 family)